MKNNITPLLLVCDEYKYIYAKDERKREPRKGVDGEKTPP